MQKLNIERISTNERGYHALNFVFIVLILSIFLYSLAFRGNNHPIPALLTEVTGEIPPSKGLSESFSEIVRGNIIDASRINPYGLQIFAFFALQLLLRIFFSLAIRIKPDRIGLMAVSDTVFSLLMFFWCFSPFISYTLKLFSSIL